MSLGEVFKDETVASLYRRRPPYPAAVFAMLRRRLVAPRTVLDAGAGTGALARGMASFAERVDAVEPSAAMIAEARRVPGGGDQRIRWIPGRAEDAPLAPPYGLITCGASLHWMDLAVVLPRFRGALAPGAVPRFDPGNAEARLALDPGQLGGAHRPAQLAVAGAIPSEQAEASAVRQLQLGSDDRVDARGPSGLDELDRAIQAVAIAEAEGSDLEAGSGAYQGSRRGSPL